MAQIGSVILGKFRVLRRIDPEGKERLSAVYLTSDEKLNKLWVVKEISKKGGNPGAIEGKLGSARKEATLMKGLSHPSIPRITDIDDTPDALYIVEDYVEGEELSSFLNVELPSSDRVIEWAKQLCDVLGYLHSQETPITYRDLKPENVIIDSNFNVKLLDFDAARADTPENRAKMDSFATPGYAAPEQYTHPEKIDARTDVYTLGSTMYHMLIGEAPPFIETADGGIAWTSAPLIREKNPALSSGLENIIARCMKENQEERFQSCDELRDALNNVRRWDNEYRRAQKRKITAFAAVAACCVLGLGISAGAKGLSSYAGQQDYDSNVQQAGSANYEDAERLYQEAVDIDPANPSAYEGLLERYTNEGNDGEAGISADEASRFRGMYSEKQGAMNDSFQEVSFQAGIANLFYYHEDNAGETNQFRVRITQASSYFENVCKGDEDEERGAKVRSYKNYEIAKSLSIVGEFYDNYVFKGIKEPDAEDYTQLLDNLDTCIDYLDGYREKEASNGKLTVYTEIAGLLYSSREGLALYMPEQENLQKVTALLDKIEQNAELLPATQEANRKLKDELLENLPIYRQEIENVYRNAANAEEEN